MGNASEFVSVEHTNRVHIKAGLKLMELKKAKWDAFGSKDCFVEAVENCLNPSTLRRQKAARDPGTKVIRVKTIVGFEDSDEPPLARIPNEVRGKLISDNDEELQRSWGEIHRTHSSFLSSPSGSREGFLHHLQVIARHITLCRKLTETTEPIRVAILDTGCQKELDFFKDDRRLNRIKGWKDFTIPESQSAINTFGHGTFMARLLMHVAPIVDIFVICVAANAEDLQNHGQNIVKAIVHAGLDPEWKADIISMSFRMPNERKKECKAISDAINKVTKERDDGAFLDSNPSQPEDGPNLLGTYGTDIPPSIMKEIQMSFLEADLSAGSSIATAIAAGVAAMILSYVAALPSLLKFK
ncbi:hypothetical protein F4825DRAFT_468932 [Nemania diffusa]|nr:hypothetical protein F4825DRAFT_468932 [Nemania diffusa]